jgi:nicotinate-nucleotide adenylyltransferase
VRQGFPQAQAGMAIGLLGGSFDPAHAGHAHITREALRRFRLDRVWWLVSPGNPLKAAGPAPLDRRITQARTVMRDPRVVITGLEVDLRTRHTAATLHRLAALYPGVRFVWLMGSDNLASFHRWRGWTDILRMMPMAVIARPGSLLESRAAPAAQRFAGHRISSREARLLPDMAAPAWTWLRAPLNPRTSTALRAARDAAAHL